MVVAAPHIPSEKVKSVVLILSTMRSGSTLLKALLAEASDVSNLPETDFQKYQAPSSRSSLQSLSPEPILLLKRPAWFNEIKSYPKLPHDSPVKKIILIRDAYENVESLRQMALRALPYKFPFLANKFFAESYWCGINEHLLNLADADPAHSTVLRYEDLLRDPMMMTKKLFHFMGSIKREGVNSYQRPKTYSWTWGKDDGGDKIKSLSVLKPKPTPYHNPHLLKTIHASKRIQALRHRLGYPPLP